MNEKVSIILSVGFHLGVLSFSGMKHESEYGISNTASARKGTDVELVRRAPKEVEVMDSARRHLHPVTEKLPEPRIKKDDLTVPKKSKLKISQTVTSTPAPTERNSSSPDAANESQKPTSDLSGGKESTGENAHEFVSASPAYYRNPPPKYPLSARTSKQEGVVKLRVHVNSDGEPSQIRIVSSSGFESLDTAAVSAVEKWRFKPALMLSHPVDSEVDIPIRFKLESK